MTSYNSNFKKSESGTTLIEVLIYILLFSFIMSATLISVNQILRFSYTSSSKTSVEQEATFIMAKINWALSNSSIILPGTITPGPVLQVNKTGVGSITFQLTGDSITMSSSPLNSDRVKITGLNFKHIQQGTVHSIKYNFSIDGKYFEAYKNIR